MPTFRDLGFGLLEHLPYSSDLIWSDFNVSFPNEEKFEIVSINEEVMKVVEAWLKEQDKILF